MEKTAQLSSQTFEYIRNNIRPGYTEMEFGGMYEAYARKIGHEGRLRVRPGIPIKGLFDTALTKAEKLGYAEPYLGPPGYKVQFIGHGIGLELIEQPILRVRAKNDAPLRPGMTFALEPKIVFKNRFSAGVESVFTVTETGHRLISRIPLKVFVC